MRIIAGKFKGKKLNTFELSTTRPTSDLVREALFDKIGFKILDCTFLDLFSGTGAIGIEALSRGAKEVCFVDKNVEAIKLIKKNLMAINVANAQVLNCDYLSALTSFKNIKKSFDIVFLDPPYKTDFAEDAISRIAKLNILNENALIVWEHDISKNDYIKTNYPFATTKKYGGKFLTYIKFDDLK